MTSIVFDYADIRSRMLGDDKPKPKVREQMDVIRFQDGLVQPFGGWANLKQDKKDNS